MKSILLIHVILSVLVFTTPIFAGDKKLPLADGEYNFEYKDAEFSHLKGFDLLVKISKYHIVVINQSESEVMPKGIIDEGELKFHTRSNQWIISTEESDILAEDVGGCSDGPTVVDLVNKIYWTC